MFNNLKYFLFFLLIIIVVYILYQKLLKALGKNKVSKNYVSVTKANRGAVAGDVALEVELLAKHNMTLEWLNAERQVLTKNEWEAEVGLQSIVIQNVPQEAVWLKVQTAFETLERKISQA